MAQQDIGLGSSANDGNGDDLRTAGGKINDNFAEIYARTGRMYVDSVDGDDSNDGLTTATPKLTLAAAVAAVPNNSTLWLKCGSRWHEPLTLTNNHRYVDIKSYGTGAWPIIDGSRPIPAENWIADPGDRVGVYYADVTYSGPMAQSSDVLHQFELFDEGGGFVKDKAFVPRYLTGSLSDRLDYVEDNPGFFTVQIQGDDVTNPLDSNQTAFRFWIKTRDGSDPASNGRTIYYSEKPQALTISLGTNLERLTVQRCCTKDMCGSTGGAGLSGQVARHCEFLSASCHATVFRGVEFEDCLATGNSRNYFASGNGFHVFRNQDTEGLGNPRVLRCESRGLFAGISTHGTGGGMEHQTFFVKDFKAVDCINGVIAKASEHIHLENILVEDCLDGITLITDGTCQVDNFKYVSATRENTGNEQRRSAILVRGTGKYVINDAVVIFRDTGNPRGEFLAINDVDAEVTLNRVINYGGLEPDLNSNRRGKLTVNDSVFGLPPTAATNFEANNSWLISGVQTIGQINESHIGVNLNCTSPFVYQPYLHTVGASEVSYFTLPGTSQGVAGDSHILLSWSVSYGAELGRIVIEGAGPGGTDLHVRELTANAGLNQSGVWRAFDFAYPATLPETFSGATAKVPYFNRNLFPVDAGTARLNDDVNYVRLSNPEHFTTGQTIILGGLANRKSYGIRKIVSLVGDLAELDEPCPWNVWVGFLVGGLRYNSLGGSGFLDPPSVPVSLGIPLLSRSVTGSTTTLNLEGKIIYVEDGFELTFTDAHTQARLLPFGAGTFTTEGVRVTSSPANGNYEPNEPLINIGFAVIPGDVIDLKWRAYVQQFFPDYMTDPEYTWDAVLRGDSYLAQRKIGPRKRTI
jgi:hypothetical protein